MIARSLQSDRHALRITSVGLLLQLYRRVLGVGGANIGADDCTRGRPDASPSLVLG
jgi:hypothetical protein